MGSNPISQHDRLYYLETPLGEDKLIVRNFKGFEGISQLYRYELELVSIEPGLPIHRLIGQYVKFAVRRSDPTQFRYLNGYVSEVMTLPPENRLFAYRIVLVPYLWFLTRTSDCRIEQKKSVREIIDGIFKRYNYNDFRFELTNDYQPWEYSTQYRESSFNYFSRLCELEGLFYYFEQKESSTVLIIGDAPSCNAPCPVQSRIEMERSYGRGYRRFDDTIHSWVVEREFQPGKFTHRDFNFERPKDSLEVQIPSASRLGNNEKFEVYDYPGEYEEHNDGNTWGRRRMEKTEVEDTHISGASNARTLAAGYRFDLLRHDRRDQNTTYVVTSVVHDGQEMNILPDQEIRESYYRNEFTCIPHSKPYRSPFRTPKHLMKGPQTATVVGPSGEMVYSDKYGRVKVQFHWDREGKRDEKSSCWIRVSHPWASTGYGALFLPRIGDEVIIDFIEGDPDRPIITGRVYNADNMPPYTLPDRQNWSGIKSRSVKSSAESDANELRFEDTKDKELFLMHAQRDMEVTVEKDIEIEIGENHSSHIKKDSVEKVGGDEDRKVTGNHTAEVSGNYDLKVGGDLTIQASGTVTISALDIILVANNKAVVQANTSVTMANSASYVDAGPSGVTISGAPMVFINGGGSKSGSGSAKTPKSPKDPKEPKRFQDK